MGLQFDFRFVMYAPKLVELDHLNLIHPFYAYLSQRCSLDNLCVCLPVCKRRDNSWTIRPINTKFHRNMQELRHVFFSMKIFSIFKRHFDSTWQSFLLNYIIRCGFNVTPDS